MVLHFIISSAKESKQPAFEYLSVVLCLPQEWNITRLTFEYDSEPYGKERDGAIIKMAQEFGVETVVQNSHTLYNLDK